MGSILLPRRYFQCQDILVCYSLGAESTSIQYVKDGNTTKRAVMYRTTPQQRIVWPKILIVWGLRNADFQEVEPIKTSMYHKCGRQNTLPSLVMEM